MNIVKVILILILALNFFNQAESAPSFKPKLILVIVCDQFNYNYLNRFKDKYTSNGLNLINQSGVSCSDCKYLQANLQTACGHSVIASGAYPWSTGIIGNFWYDRAKKTLISSVSDSTKELVGSNGVGSSLHYLTGTTFTEEIKLTNKNSKIFSLSLKDRSSIILGGRLANLALFYDESTGYFVSSSQFGSDLPQYIKTYNESHYIDKYIATPWTRLLKESDYSASTQDDFTYEASVPSDGNKFPHLFNNETNKYKYFGLLPYSNDALTDLAKLTIDNERLGTHDACDVLLLGYSALDYIGHAFGPYSQEAEDACLRLDLNISDLITYLKNKNILDDTLIVFSADHGSTPIPEYLNSMGLTAGRVDKNQITNSLNSILSSKFGNANWVEAFEPPNLYINLNTIDQKNIRQQDVEVLMANLIHSFKGIAEVFTANQFFNNKLPNSPLAQAARRSYYFGRSGELFVTLKPGYIFSSSDKGTSHGSYYSCDRQVPLIFYNPQIESANIIKPTSPADIAATISNVLSIQEPSCCQGKIINLTFKPKYGPLK